MYSTSMHMGDSGHHTHCILFFKITVATFFRGRFSIWQFLRSNTCYPCSTCTYNLPIKDCSTHNIHNFTHVIEHICWLGLCGRVGGCIGYHWDGRTKKHLSTGHKISCFHINNSPNAERDSNMPCAVKSSFKTSLQISLWDYSYRLPYFSYKTDFFASNLRSLFSGSDLRSSAIPWQNVSARAVEKFCGFVNVLCTGFYIYCRRKLSQKSLQQGLAVSWDSF